MICREAGEKMGELVERMEESLEEMRTWASRVVPLVREGEEEVEYFHVTSRSHLSEFLLETEEAKRILEEQILHYARVCGIGVLHYCVMDNHMHLVVVVGKESLALRKMVGGIKQQFTVRFKRWFNGEYRRNTKYRRAKMGVGTLWEKPFDARKITTGRYLAACSLYVENNRVMVECGEGVEDQELLEVLKGSRYQSAGWYLGRREEDCGVSLTDGRDGVWASEEEVREWWSVAAAKLPEGWRKVWFEERRGILKPTPGEGRRYARHPFVDGLGEDGEERSRVFGGMLVEAFWRSKSKVRRDAGTGRGQRSV